MWVVVDSGVEDMDRISKQMQCDYDGESRERFIEGSVVTR